MNQLYRLFLIGVLLLSLAAGAAEKNAAIAPHAENLVSLKGDALVPANAKKLLAAPYTVLYFGAGWCPDCVKFSPKLVEAYGRQPGGRPRFEVLFISRDKTADGMLAFMKKENMKWPALAFDKVAAAEDLKKYYSGKGIPCLSIIDQKGTLVLQSKSDQDGAEVLQELQALLEKQK